MQITTAEVVEKFLFYFTLLCREHEKKKVSFSHNISYLNLQTEEEKKPGAFGNKNEDKLIKITANVILHLN